MGLLNTFMRAADKYVIGVLLGAKLSTEDLKDLFSIDGKISNPITLSEGRYSLSISVSPMGNNYYRVKFASITEKARLRKIDSVQQLNPSIRQLRDVLTEFDRLTGRSNLDLMVLGTTASHGATQAAPR